MKQTVALAKVLVGFVHYTGGQCKSVRISVSAYNFSSINLFGKRTVQANSC